MNLQKECRHLVACMRSEAACKYFKDIDEQLRESVKE